MKSGKITDSIAGIIAGKKYKIYILTCATDCGTMTVAAKMDGIYNNIAGWSSPVARWAHNPKAESSNLSPATTKKSSR